MSRRIFTFNPNTDTPVPFSTTLGNEAMGGSLYIWNESSSGIDFILPGQAGEIVAVPPWMGYPIKTFRRPAPTLLWTIPYSLNSSSAPIERCDIHVFDADEPLPSDVPIPLPRQTNVGNTVGTTSATGIKNDGNGPATQWIESTPSDQSASSFALNNDASGFIQVLSANVLRKILNVVRGNSGSGKAAVTFGDSGDPTIATFYGSIQGGQPANVGALTAGAVTCGTVSIPVNTTGGNIELLDWNDSAAGGHRYGLFMDSDHALHIFDFTNSRDTKLMDTAGGINVSGAAVVNGNLTAVSLTGGTPTNAGALQILATNAQGFRVASITDHATLNQNADILDLVRDTNQAATFTFGIAPNQTFYIFDVNNGAFAASSISGLNNNAVSGKIATTRSAGGGTAGFVIFEGTTDPGGNAGEGDLWVGA